MKALGKIFFRTLALSAVFIPAAFFFLSHFITERVEELVAKDWLIPLDTGRRQDWASLMITPKGYFLAERPPYAHLPTHVHTGVDLQNRYRGGPGEDVYAVARGKVYDVKFQDQGTRVTLLHFLPNGEIIFTSYIHVSDIRVRKGMLVGSQTVIAKRFTEEELKKYGGLYDHLHFQVHKHQFVPEHTIATGTQEEAEGRFYNPEWIFYHHHQDVRSDWKGWLKEGKISLWKLLGVILIFQLTGA